MKESGYKSCDELPLFLNAAMMAKVLGVSPSGGYELMYEQGFPSLKIGNRIVSSRRRSSVGWRNTQEVQCEQILSLPQA